MNQCKQQLISQLIHTNTCIHVVWCACLRPACVFVCVSAYICVYAGMLKLSGGAMDEVINANIPLGRMGTKWEIGQCIVYLASSAGKYVSGNSSIIVDGAQVLWKPAVADRDTVRGFSRQIESKSRQTGLAGLASKL